MAEDLTIDQTATKADRYASLLPQMKALVEGENDWVANVSNLMGALKEAMGFFWVGVYRVKGQELVLGPFQGPVACTRIQFGKGVCGTVWKEAKAIIVDDVDQFPGHISCSSLSRSEIVVPVLDRNGDVAMVLDVDSTELAGFDATDLFWLEEVATLITSKLPS